MFEYLRILISKVIQRWVISFVDMATRKAFTVSLAVSSFGEQRPGALQYGLYDVSMESRDVAFQGFTPYPRLLARCRVATDSPEFTQLQVLHAFFSFLVSSYL
jgi:hypothetical protein